MKPTLRRKTPLLAALLLASPMALPAGEIVTDTVDWPTFLARHDLVFETLPRQFIDGAFLGNGMLGAMFYRDGYNRLRWEMGRTDVTEHRRDNNRLPIGGLVLETVGKIRDGTMRLDLWNAEMRGTVATDKGTLQFRAFIHSDVMAMILDVETTGDEKAAKFVWVPSHGQDPRNQFPGRKPRFNDPPNPPATTETIDGLQVCIQPRFAGGEFATAWKETATPQGRRIDLSIADSFPGNTARREVVATVRQTAAAELDKLVASHRAWWHALYPRSFVSVPDPRLESFYWIQFYKLGSASRPDRGPVDLLGPWSCDTSWPRIWWDLNIQTLYLPVYTANQLELGESFINFLDAKRANFVRNAKDKYGFEDCALVTVTTDNQGLRGDGSCAPDHFTTPGDLTWALHNYYQHYRYSMDHALVTNQTRHAFYPLLRGSINLYLHLLKKGDEGKLHLPLLMSPEYGGAADNNYNLALLRWGCQTLIDVNERYRLTDPLLPRWQETLANLTPYPVDENGLSIGADVPLAKPHRHWSHLLMAHPLHIMDLDQAANRELLSKSLDHWLAAGNTTAGDGIYGWSRAGAASLYAALGDGDNALASIHQHMADKRFVRPNTMYIEGNPVIECSIVLARSLQDMLLQSHNNLIRVFPAVPAAWTNAVFHNLRAEGAFLVSAERKAGKTQWVRVKSLAGEPCRIQFNGRSHELKLAQGEETLLGDGPAIVTPLPIAPAEANPHGLRATQRSAMTAARADAAPKDLNETIQKEIKKSLELENK